MCEREASCIFCCFPLESMARLHFRVMAVRHIHLYEVKSLSYISAS